MSSTGVCSSINLKGSVKIICEFFDYAINNILYQRGIYPAESFRATQNYGLTIFMSTDERVKKYLAAIFRQLQAFLLHRQVHRIVMVIARVDTKETIERWEFTVSCDKNVKDEETLSVDLNEIQNGIKNVIRQITASVTYLPLIDTAVSFDILLYTDKCTELPSQEWADTTSHLIPNAEEVKLRSFSTKIHNLKAAVAYKSSND